VIGLDRSARRHQSIAGFRNNPGSFAMLAAIRRAYLFDPNQSSD
jgi:hypothetical protein